MREMGTTASRIIDIGSLFAIVVLCLWLTAFAFYGSVVSILLIVGLVLSFAGSKEPYRKGFISIVLLSALFISSPTEIEVRQGDHAALKVLPITYGFRGHNAQRQEEQDEIAGGCVVTPFSPHWRLLVVVP